MRYHFFYFSNHFWGIFLHLLRQGFSFLSWWIFLGGVGFFFILGIDLYGAQDPKALPSSVFKKAIEEYLKTNIPQKKSPGFLGLRDFWDEITNPHRLLAYATIAVRIVIICIVFAQLWRWIRYFIEQVLPPLIQKKKHNYSEDKIQGVIRTLVPVVRSGVGWILAILFILIILSELHINIEPIIYSLGVLSLAFSIGAQMLVRDLINGFLALFEGSISVGDYVKIGEAKGIVEEISLRCVYLRYHCGTLHVIPFSEVTNVINFCKDYKIHIIHLKIPTTMCYEDIEKIIQETSKDISLTPSLAFMILEPLSLKGISKYTYDSVEIIVEIKTLPDPEDIFFFAVNSKIKNAFDQKALSKTDLKKDNIF